MGKFGYLVDGVLISGESARKAEVEAIDESFSRTIESKREGYMVLKNAKVGEKEVRLVAIPLDRLSVLVWIDD